MNRTIPELVLVGLLSASPVVNANATLGILEEAPQPPDSSTLGTNLRLAFRKVADAWQPICESKGSPPWRTACKADDLSSLRDWTVLERGTPIGTVKTAGWLSEDRYASEGLLRVTSAIPPRSGERTLDYAGWPGKGVHAPLVAVSGASPHGSNWKRITAIAATKSRVFPAFRRLVPQIPSCKQDDSGKGIGKPSPTRLSDVDVIRALEAIDGRMLVGLRIAQRLSEDCSEGGGFASDAWFYVSRAGLVRLLPGRQDDSWPEFTVPIDIADFDGDGKEEAVFWFSGYNEDGYLLFDRDFTRVVRFTWGYH